MIKTREQYDLFKGWLSMRGSSLEGNDVTTHDAVETIESLRPFLRLAREERIVPIGSWVTSCTLCDTSWLTDEKQDKEYPLLDYQEHHEKTCLFYGIPGWLSEAPVIPAV